MRKYPVLVRITVVVCFMATTIISNAQTSDAIVDSMVAEAFKRSQLEPLAKELLDGIGPRLVGSPGMQQANDWAVEKYKSWGINARNEQWGEWRGWERGFLI